MNTQQIKDFRQSVLMVLDAAGIKHGLTVDAIMLHVRRFGFCPQKEEVEKQLHYLAGEPLKHIEVVDAGGFSPEIKNWRLTTRGINFLAEQTS